MSEPGMHTRGHASDAAWSRHMRKLGQVLFSEDSEAKHVAVSLEEKAQGHDDLPSVQAARRVLEKRKARRNGTNSKIG